MSKFERYYSVFAVTALLSLLIIVPVVNPRPVHRVPGISMTLRSHYSSVWNGRCFLDYPRVNGQRGQWNSDRTEYVWSFIHDGQWTGVSFNGVSFYNGTHHSVHVSAHC